MGSRKSCGINGRGSSSGGRRCELCGCQVPGNEQAWQTHISGIRHRRNVASHKLFGEPGHAVLSVFEHVNPARSPAYLGKDAVLLAAKRAAAGESAQGGGGPRQAVVTANLPPCRPGQAAAAADSLCEQLQHLQRQVRKHLATQVGVSATYSRAVERFSMEALSAAAEQLKTQIAEHVQQGREQQQVECCTEATQQLPSGRQQLQRAPLQQGDGQSQQQLVAQHPQQPEQWQQNRVCGLQLQLVLQDAAQIACLSVLLPAGVKCLHLTVPYQSYGPGAAASSAAVACCMASLAHHHSLQQLEVHFHCTVYNNILRQGGNSLAELPGLWGKTVAALTAAMQVNCGLQRMLLAAYPGQFPVDSVAQLQTCLATSRSTLRMAVLLGTHPRVGAASPLASLPREVLAALLDMAVPRQGCRLHLELPQGLAGDSSSDDDDFDDADDDDDDDDDDGAFDDDDDDDDDDADDDDDDDHDDAQHDF